MLGPGLRIAVLGVASVAAAIAARSGHGLPTVFATGRMTVVARPGALPLSAAANSAALPHRSAGSLASAVSTASSTSGGTVSRRLRIGAGLSVITLATMACAVGPVKGGSPSSIS